VSTCVVTGCAGFIGSHLSEALLADGHRVIGLDCFNNNYGRHQKLRNLDRSRDWDGFEFVPIDLSRGELSEFGAECDVIFHLAAEPGVRHSWGKRFDAYVRNNVVATQLLLDAVRPWPDKRFVYASSSSIYGEAESLPTAESATPRPMSPYGATKLAGEHMCEMYAANFGVHSTMLRYFSVYGPRQRPDMAFNLFCRAAIAGEPIQVFGDGRQTRDFTYVDDVVAATRAAATAAVPPASVFNIGGGSRISVRDALTLLEEYVGRPLEIEYTDAQSGDVRDTGADTTRARALLGFAPATSFGDGLQAEFEWLAEAHRGSAAAVSASPSPML
jgi:UDP-glucuronate 4-epimerase